MFFNNTRQAEVTFYSPSTGLQTVVVNANNRQGAERIIQNQFGSVQIMRVNMSV